MVSFTNSTSFPQLDRFLLFLFSFGTVLLYLGYTGYEATRPVYPTGSLPSDARGGGSGSCRMTFMSPSYFRLGGFGRNETRLGNGPWGLYLYREAGWDDDPVESEGEGGAQNLVLSGTPVLFVPGNAGSFKQVRSLASTATRTFWQLPGMRREGGEWGREGSTSLDFFTLDFNDDFSAFHGQTLFDQAEYTADAIRYILDLYRAQDQPNTPAPTSLVVVAHSMGGIVARAAFLDPHYVSNSISTLITFATPHLVPPVTVDSRVDQFYSSINSYWREAYHPSGSSDSPLASQQSLRDVVLISINGGISDEMIASETASLSSIVPENDSNGFAVSTTAIPGVQTPMDHLAILWCQQLMQVVAESILSIVDSRSSSRVLSRQDRVNIFSNRLLGGLERKQHPTVSAGSLDLEVLEQGNPARRLGIGERLVLRPEEARSSARTTYLMPVSRSLVPSRFSLISSAPSVGSENDKPVQVFACTDSRSPSEGSTAISCAPVSSSHITLLPSSPHHSLSPILPASVGDETMKLVTLSSQHLENVDFMAIVARIGSEDWLLAELADEMEQVQIVNRGPLSLLVNGFRGNISLKSAASLISEVQLPALDTALLSLKLRVSRSPCHEKDSLFAPLLRQYSTDVHEYRYYPNVRLASLYTHSAGPYLPRSTSSGARLQFFLDPTCARLEDGSQTVEIEYEIKVDLLRTIGNLFLRYRMALVTMPFAIVSLVIATQLHEFYSGHSFPPFEVALSIFARRHLPALLVTVTGFAYLQSLLSHFKSSSIEGSSSVPTWIRDSLLGTSDLFWVPFFPFLLLASFSIVCLEYLILSLLVNTVAFVGRALAARNRLVNSMLSFDMKDSHLSPFQRIIALVFLLLFTIFFAPYQFAYLVLFLVHLLTTIRLLVSARTFKYTPLQQREGTEPPSSTSETSATVSNELWDQFQFAFSILFLLLSLLPMNALILIVWVRNLAVGSFAPFSSDHQVFSILGFLAVVESVHSGKMLSRLSTSSSLSRISSILAISIAAYSLLYGIRSAHRIYVLGNVLAGWLAFLTSVDQFFGGASSSNEAQKMTERTTRKVATTLRSQD
ncbi:hypothetical protein JCM5350_001203 [Sporobolomyces pararoseus]